MSTWTGEELHGLYTDLATRFDADPAFRERAQADLQGVLRELAGRELPPEAARLRIEPLGQGFQLIAAGEGGELSDHDLESVAGGLSQNAQYGIVTGVMAVGVGAFFGYQQYKSGGSAQSIAGMAAFGAALGAGAAVGGIVDLEKKKHGF